MRLWTNSPSAEHAQRSHAAEQITQTNDIAEDEVHFEAEPARKECTCITCVCLMQFALVFLQCKGASLVGRLLAADSVKCKPAACRNSTQHWKKDMVMTPAVLVLNLCCCNRFIHLSSSDPAALFGRYIKYM